MSRMARVVRVSTVQMPTVIDGKSFADKQEQNREEIESMLRIAGERESDLVLFGEYANLHHRTWSTNKEEYVSATIPGDLTKRVAKIAKRFSMNVALPMFGVWQNALSSYVVLFSRKGEIVDCYQKSHPTVPEREMGIQAGDKLPVYNFDFGKVGIMTCMDIEYPEVALALMLKGAELLLFPHVQASWGEVDWEIRYRARAVDTGLHVVSAAYGYPEGEWMPGMMIGRSGVVGRDGLILGDLGRGIGILTMDLDLDQKRITQFYFNEKFDRTLAIKGSRRPELYEDLVKTKYREEALRVIKKQRK